MERFAVMFAFTDGDRWRPGIGDPTFIGWFTVVAYFLAAFLCWRALTKGLHTREVRWFWMGLTALLVLLGINKQLDFQTEITFLGKDFAKATGWYEHRRPVQVAFILSIAFGGAVVTTGLGWIYRGEWKRLGGALVGVGFLMSFIVIRAASFHHVDRFLNFSPGGVRMNWVLELGGIAAIAIPAWRAGRRSSETGFVWMSGNGVRGPIAGPRKVKVR